MLSGAYMHPPPNADPLEADPLDADPPDPSEADRALACRPPMLVM